MSRQDSDRLLFNQIAERYARKDVVPSSSLARESQLISAIAPLLAQSPNLGTIVEVGCGVGAPAKYLEGHYDHYIGIDQSEEMIRTAVFLHEGNSKADFMSKNVKSRDLPGNVADIVLSVGALHHMTQLEDVLSSLSRVAKQGAFLVIIEPQNGNPLIRAMRYVRGIVDLAYSRQQIFFSAEELLDLLADQGITVLSVVFQGFLSPPFAQVVVHPQIISVPLSRLAVIADSWLDTHLPEPLKKLGFNVVVTGRFDG
jgi:SAM-dependent methyltransferase